MNYISAFKTSVQQNADKPALIDFDGTRQTTYKELDRLSNRVAGKLHAAGCCKGSFIPVFIERRMEYMAAYLGILKAGCVVVPLVPEIPKDRISYITNHCDAKLTIDISFFDDVETYEPFEDLAGDNEPALLIYTSGSTGTPKGILHTNSSLFSSAERTKILSEGVSPIIFAAAAPFSFIIHIQEYLCIFLLSGCVHILSNTVTHSLPLLEEYYARHSITAGYLTPKIIPIFTPPSSLQKICTGGDSLLSSPVSGNYRISYLYGQGETCSAVCTNLIEKTCKNPSLGKPFSGIEIRILDESGNEVPHGLEGEICVIGEFGVEYFKSPEETKGTFIKTDDGKTLIHTGDIGFIDENGDVNYVTRKDWMVKINGQRVELLEVERILQSVEQIKEAAVKAFSDADSQNYLVGYYVSDADLSIEDIRISLAEKLPSYMIPRYLVCLDEIPKNQNGKTDRTALSLPESSFYKTVYAAPSTPEEQALCAAFEEILECENVSIHDDFFALGGDSIKVMKLLAAEPVKGLTLESVVNGKTPEAIANLCTQRKEDAYQVQEMYPLTQTQLGIFSECAATPESSIYNIPSLYKLDDAVDIDKLKSAIITAVNAHPYIKMVLTISEDGDILAKRDDTAEINMRIIDCDHLTKVQPLVRPFDILKFGSPLYRIAIYRTKDGNYLFTDFHHTICDGTSAGILLEDINQAYAGLAVENEKYTGFEVTIDEQRIRKSSRYSEAKEYYKKLLGTSSSLSIIPYNTKKSTRAAIVSHVSQLDAESVKTYCLKHKITINTFCNTAFSLVLAKYTNSRNILYSTVYNGRNNPHYIRSVGMLVKTLPVVSRITDYRTFLELAAALQTELQNSMVHDCYSPADIVSESHAEIDDGIAFVYQGDSRKQIEIGGKPAAAVNLSPDTAKTALSVEVFVLSSRFELICQYRAGQYDDTLANSILADIERTMREALDSSSLSEISVLREKYQAYNAVQLSNDNEDKNYITFFKKSVQQNGDKPALVDFDGTRQTTYKELDRLSSCVAGKLHAAGCSKGSFIPILIERRMEYMAAYLGILKAGCVVVPLVPEIPKERISYITTHCDAKLTIDISFFDDVETYEPFEDLAEGDDPALLIYTSGSTGTPKGILHTANSVAHSIERIMPMHFGLKSRIVAATIPLSFIVHVQEYLLSFLSGGTVHILSDEQRKSPGQLIQYYEKHSITCGFIPAQMLRFIPALPKSVDHISTGGEQLTAIPESLNTNIYYLYGQGETCSGVTLNIITADHRTFTLGKALDGIEISIVDENGNAVKNGEKGEICVKGRFGVEYFKSPEATKETFIKTSDGKTLVHTGDIGFIDKNGDLNYVCRKDWVVKINGQRVETLEVERILQSVEHIREAAVKAFSDADSQNYLVGYYVSDAELSIDDIRISLAEKLPAYMIPRYLVRLDAIPKNQNGKTDRNVLTSPDISLYKTVYAAPSTPEEQVLCAAFEEVLECEKVGIHDDFFALGGDSIKVMKLLSTTRLSWLSTDIIYRERTPEKIASRSRNEIDAAFPAQEDYPLTQDQLGMFTVSFEHAGETVYNMPGYRKLQSGVNLSKVQEALKLVINAHPYLKMYLRANENGDIRAVRNDAAEPVVSLLTCDHLPEMQTLIRPFTLLNAPLYRLELYDTADGKYLFFDFHHIIGDGTSLSLLMHDISSAYAGLPLLKETYTGFEAALIEENERKSSRFAQAKEYYDRLFEEAEISSLPVDYENPGTNKGIITTAYKSDLRVGDVQAFCRQHDITENVFFNTAFGYLLSIYSGQDKVYYSSVYHGRTRAGFAATLSLLATVLPVCYQFEESKTVTATLKEIQEHLRCAMEYPSISQSDITRFYGLAPDVGFAYQGSNAELFESVLFRDTESGNPGRVEQTLFADETNPGTYETRVLTRYHLAVQVFLQPDGTYELFCEGNAALFGEEFLQDFLSCYDYILTEFLRKETLASVSVVSDKVQALLDEIDHTDYEVDLTQTVVDRFRARAAASSESVAVVFEEKRLTYREVDEISDRIAAHLVFHGVGKEKIVGILLPVSEYMPMCAMGVLKSGGAYLPLDAAYPLNALKFMIQDAGIQFLITTPDEYQKVKEVYSGDVLTTDEIVSLPVCTIQLPHPNPEDLCMVLYTSGSTGLPKGVMIEHRNIISTCVGTSDYLRSSNSRHLAAYGSFSWIPHISDYYGTLICGRCLYILSPDIRRDLRKMQKYINENQINYMHITSHVGRELAQLGGTKTLRRLYLLGEKIIPFTPSEPDLVQSIYGCTEAGLIAYHQLDRYYASVPLGKASYNTRLHVIGKNGTKLLPPGAIGELWVSGFGIGRGYLNQPEKTAEVFCKNPFCSEKGYDHAYRTGDIVSLTKYGILYFSGRRDEQVKIRGNRVELGEVEAAVRRFTGVKDAAVIAVAKDTGEKFLVAYVVSDTQIDAKSLKQFVAAEKPSYMVPSVVMQIDAIPYNRNMKVDKRVLPKAKFVVEDIIPPQNELQRKLFGIIANVLGHDKFGINTNFTDAGLTSLSSVKLLILLGKEFNVPVNLSTIFEYNTIEKLAEHLQNAEEYAAYEIQETYPLTQTEKEVAATCMRNPDAAMYNNPILCKLETDVDIEKLKSAIITAVNAHPYIKATLIADESGELRAQRNDADTVHLSVITCDTPPDLQTFVRPFSLIESPLYRFEIYSSNDETYLFADFHHIICDGTSLMLLAGDIAKAYLGEDIEAESYTGFDAALTEEKARTGTKYQQDKEYYTNLLDGCDTDSTLYPDSISSNEKLGITEHICTADFEEVKKFCSKHNISENAFFNAVFSLVLSKYTDSTEVLYATVYNGRNDSRLSRTFTMQIKAFPVFSQIQKDESFVQFAEEMQTRLLNGMAHDLYSFAEILASCRLNADTYFIYQADSFNPTEFARDKITQIPLPPNAAKSALQIYLSVVDNKLNLYGEFRTNTYSEFLIQSFFTSFDTAVKECLTVNLLSEISLITPAATQLLNEFNATDAAYNSTQTVVDCVHESVQKHQDKTAVVFKDTRLTYKELDEITDNLAEYLCKNGVGAETVVGILIPRNEYMPICALGVLKAGGAYLPLDSTYPKDRLNFMLKDSGAVLLIVDKSLDGLIDEFSGKRLFTDEVKSLPNRSRLLPKPKPDDLFVVFYTSGSTGVPKGVMLTHQNATAFCSAWIARSHELDETARVGAYASFGFDAAIQDMYPTLIRGAELHIIPEELRLDLIGLRTYFNTHGITHCDMTTQIGRQFAHLGGFTTLKEQSVGGEKLVPFIPPSYAFYDTYGPTECTVVSTAFRLESQHTNSSIGKPINNVRCYVVDKNGMLLPPGAVGELWLSGPQVARGYLNRPEKTAEVFTKNTFSTHRAHSVVYHTGDIVRYLSDGNIQFIERRDSQVKIRGFRVDLSEVEEVISRFSGIKDAAVVAYDNPSGGKYLAAYVVSDNPVDIKALNAFIAAEKPPYMVPAVTMQIDALPHNQNMKVNRKELPIPELTAADAVPPQNELQQKIFDIVSKVLGYSGFGITTSFSDAGLDSIRAVKLLMLLGNEFNIPIKYTEIRQCDTIEKLEEYIRNAKHVKTGEILSDYPLLETQKVIYNACMQHPKSALYHIPTVIQLNENIDLLKLKSAVEKAINAHPYLKAYLITTEDNTVRIKRNDEAEPVVSIIPVHPGEQLNIKPGLYNLLESRLYDAEIYTAENANYLLLDVHHIIFDGTSLAVLLRDIISAYSGLPLIPEMYSGFDAANEEEKALTNGRYERDKEYYDELFAGRDILSRLQTTEDVAGHSDSIRYVPEKLTVNAVRKYCAEHHLTENAFFNAAFGFVLSRYTGKPFVFSSLYHGRGDSRLINTTAMLAKRLPVLCTIPNEEEVAVEFILSIQKQIMNSMEHDICSYSYLNEKYGINADVILRYQGDGFTSSVSEIGEVVNQSVASGAFEELLNQYEIPMSSIGVSIFIEGSRFEIIAHKSDVYSHEFIEKILVALEDTAVGFLTGLP